MAGEQRANQRICADQGGEIAVLQKVVQAPFRLGRIGHLGRRGQAGGKRWRRERRSGGG